jgi:hypothetical protein
VTQSTITIDLLPNLSPLIWPGYPQKKTDRRRKHDAQKPQLDRVQQIYVAAWRITDRKPESRDPPEEKMSHNAKSTRQAEADPTSKNTE